MFWNKNKTVVVTGETKISDIDMLTTKPSATQPADEWIEVTGYKATDLNMQCRDNFQYELDKVYYISDETRVKNCSCGYHFCKNLHETAFYYNDILHSRYFFVKAVVRKSDYEKYEGKIAAKQIQLIKEITLEEKYALYVSNAIDGTFIDSFEKFCKYNGMSYSDIAKELKKNSVKSLIDLGYSTTFATVLIDRINFVKHNTICSNSYYLDTKSSISLAEFDVLYKKAKAFKEEGLSPDMCAYLLLK